mgnify:CR=1 FL=1
MYKKTLFQLLYKLMFGIIGKRNIKREITTPVLLNGSDTKLFFFKELIILLKIIFINKR